MQSSVKVIIRYTKAFNFKLISSTDSQELCYPSGCFNQPYSVISLPLWKTVKCISWLAYDFSMTKWHWVFPEGISYLLSRMVTKWRTKLVEATKMGPIFNIFRQISRSRVRQHRVENPSTVDPQWNILYWGSKRNVHTVCWGAVGCEWGQPLFILGTNIDISFIFVKSINWKTHPKSLKKIHVGLKFESGL